MGKTITFTQMRDMLIENFKTMERETLFEVNLDKDKLWEIYLAAFPAGSNPIYRERTVHDCSCCRHFIKSVGNVVIIDRLNKIKTIWDFETEDDVYQPVLNAMSAFVKSHVVTDVFFTKEKYNGCLKNYENSNGIKEWTHFYLEIPRNHVVRSVGEAKGPYRDKRNVFKRSLEEISLEAIETILELIASNSLYKGEEWKAALMEFKKYHKEYAKLPEEEKENWTWRESYNLSPAIAKIRNHSMGVLLQDISKGEDLDAAVRRYEAIVAPSNYKRPKAIFTKKMLEDAKKTISELGYMDALNRRFATLDDINVNNILFSNKDAKKRITGVNDGMDLFASMEQDVTLNPKQFSRVEEVSIDKFINDILPTARELEVLLENKHASNMVSLIAPMNTEAKSMFKWANPYSWAYSGNMTDSMMKERVKAAGGKVDGDLRFSIQWNDTNEYSRNDVDAHCREPKGNEIYFGLRKSRYTQGELDVDITGPLRNVPAVENITWANRSTMIDGKYTFYVHQFANRGGRDGFRAEIEFDGQLFSYDYNKELRQGESIVVAEVTLKNGNFTIEHKLPVNESMQSKDIWEVKSNQFTPVSVVMYSPNYWDEQSGIGHKHYFFMLKGCQNPEEPNGYYNEFLKPELEKHKRVFEALGAKAKVEFVEDQLSGVGFSSTKRAELIVKVKGATERVVKIKF